MTHHQDIQTNLPLTEATVFILLSLAPAPKHGYAIMKDVQTLSEGRLVLSTGTLYGALKRLLDQGWIERVDEKTATENGIGERGRPRKAYALTRLGQRILDAEVTRLQALVSLARLRVAGRQA
jgi:DNA-binding PadR family transcriptional regulator